MRHGARKRIVTALAGLVLCGVPYALDALPVYPTQNGIYFREGFSSAWTVDFSERDPRWKPVPADLNHCTALLLNERGVARFPSRPRFSLRRYPAATFTLACGFDLTRAEAAGGRVLGMYVPQIAVNWEIHVNGHVVRSELFTDETGSPRVVRDLRFVRFPVPAVALREGRNVLAFRIVGDPTFVDTGIYRWRRIVIDDYQRLLRRHSETVYLSLIVLYLFVGVYHLFLFTMRRKESFNLFFGLFSCVLFVYLYSRTYGAQDLVPDIDLLRRIEFISLFSLFPIIGAFLDLVLGGRVGRFTMGNAAYSGVLVLLVITTPLPFAIDVLRVWQVSAVAPLLVILHQVIRSFANTMRDLRRAGSAASGIASAFPAALLKTVPGNLLVGSVIMIIFTVYDIVDAMYFNRNIILVRYGFSVFVLGIAFVLANRFRQVHEQVERLNLDLGQKLAELGEASETIRLSEEKYKHLVEDSRDVIFTIDADLRLLTVNRAVYDHLKLDPERLVGSPFMSMLYSGTEDAVLSRKIIQEKIAALYESGDPVSFTAFLNTGFGSEPREMLLRLELITIAGRRQILGKASSIEEDFLFKHFVTERQTFVIGNFITSADEVSLRITRNCARFIDARQVKYLRIALREVIINAIEHGNLCISFNEKSEAIVNDRYLKFIAERRNDPRYRDRTIVIEYSLNSRRVLYRITDQGDGFDHRGFMRRIDEVNSNMLLHGRGIMMAHNTFTAIRYNDKGNRVRLVKYFS